MQRRSREDRQQKETQKALPYFQHHTQNKLSRNEVYSMWPQIQDRQLGIYWQEWSKLTKTTQKKLGRKWPSWIKSFAKGLKKTSKSGIQYSRRWRRCKWQFNSLDQPTCQRQESLSINLKGIKEQLNVVELNVVDTRIITKNVLMLGVNSSLGIRKHVIDPRDMPPRSQRVETTPQ